KLDNTVENIAAPFFNIKDDYHVKVDLRLTASVGVETMDLLYGVNQVRRAVEFLKDLPEFLDHAAVKTTHHIQKLLQPIDTSGLWRSPSNSPESRSGAGLLGQALRTGDGGAGRDRERLPSNRNGSASPNDICIGIIFLILGAQD